MDSVRLYLRYVSVSLRSELQYRVSFLLLALGHFVSTGVEVLGIWALFARFGELPGWTLPEVGVFYGLVNVSFAVGEAFGRGFDGFPELVKTGDFDRLLLRPRSAALQVAAREVQAMRIGRLIQGAIVLAASTHALGVVWTAAHFALLGFAILGGACLFVGLFVLQATMAFWTVETLELMNALTYGGTETAQYPLSIYAPWFRRLFTLVVPLACVSYFPALALLGRSDAALGCPDWFRWTAPAVGMAFLAISLLLWRVGVRHYRSTGS